MKREGVLILVLILLINLSVFVSAIYITGGVTSNITSSNETFASQQCSLPEVLEQKACSYNGMNYSIKRSAESGFIFSYSGVTEEFSLESLAQITLSNGVIVQRVILTGGEYLKFLTSTSNETTPTNQTLYPCTDSDGGMNYLVKGTITVNKRGASSSSTDYCNYYNDPETLGEYYCGDNVATIIPYTCPYGCSNGACLRYPSNITNQTAVSQQCSLAELEAKECYYSGTIYLVKRITQCQLQIYYNGISEGFELPMLAQRTLKNGVYIKNPNPCSSTNLNLFFGGEEKPIVVPSENEAEDIPSPSYFCQGCGLEGKCYPFGYRKSGIYCSDSGEFTAQLEADSACDNNFECSSNVCVNSTCVSGSLIQKIISWFKKLFGIQ